MVYFLEFFNITGMGHTQWKTWKPPGRLMASNVSYATIINSLNKLKSRNFAIICF